MLNWWLPGCKLDEEMTTGPDGKTHKAVTLCRVHSIW